MIHESCDTDSDLCKCLNHFVNQRNRPTVLYRATNLRCNATQIWRRRNVKTHRSALYCFTNFVLHTWLIQIEIFTRRDPVIRTFLELLKLLNRCFTSKEIKPKIKVQCCTLKTERNVVFSRRMQRVFNGLKITNAMHLIHAPYLPDLRPLDFNCRRATMACGISPRFNIVKSYPTETTEADYRNLWFYYCIDT